VTDIRSARFAAWGTAFLAGRTSLDEATLRIVGGDRGHDVVGLEDCCAPVGLTLTLGTLRRNGVVGLRLALVAPGDPHGLPGPANLTAAAIDAGEAVLTAGGEPLALVPRVAGEHVLWQAYAASSTPPPMDSIGAAERALAEVLGAATQELDALDISGGDADIEARIAQFRAADAADAGTLPPGYPPRSARLLTLADRVSGIVELARTCTGAAHGLGAQRRRTAVLDELARAARHARVAAYNAVLEPAR
jgi:hypothetical protein